MNYPVLSPLMTMKYIFSESYVEKDCITLLLDTYEVRYYWTSMKYVVPKKKFNIYMGTTTNKNISYYKQ